MSVVEKRYWVRGLEIGKRDENHRIINLLKDNSRCTLDGGHDTNGFCFCEAIPLIQKDQERSDES
jgi:hypothetical protein